MKTIEQMPQQMRAVADIGVWGVAAAGWLQMLQPWLTALATVLAICWTCVQMYSWYDKKRKNAKGDTNSSGD